MLGCAIRLNGGWEMNPQRFSRIAVTRRPTALAGWIVLWLAAFGSTGIENTGAAPFREQDASSVSTDRELAMTPQVTAMVDPAAGLADVPAAAEIVAWPSLDVVDIADMPEAPIQMASTDSSQVLPTETSTLPSTTPGIVDPNAGQARQRLDSVEVLDECFVVDACIDRYLWALYQRAPKEDTIKQIEKRRVTVKRKGKMVTVTRSFTKLVDQDFTWEDPNAAAKAGRQMMDYVIGGMDRSFKLKLFRTLYAAEMAGLSPGITSAFRDDYRQSIASGLKAASNRSYHGGSLRGGYGHGLAADIVGVGGGTRAERWVSSEKLWKWIDAHGKEFGIGRPYLDRDPPHVAPVDGQEFASHGRKATAQHVAPDPKKRKRLAARPSDNSRVIKLARH
jgi:hypothetical protein